MITCRLFLINNIGIGKLKIREKEIMNTVRKIIKSIKSHWHAYKNMKYIRTLRKKGVKIGERTQINPHNTIIDATRPSLVTIGNDCYLNSGFTLFTHDFVAGVMRNVFGEFINSSGRVSIGNNVRTGVNVTILKGVTIGDNCFIAANSLVTKSMPSNSIIAGSPAKVICSLKDYYQKRLTTCDEEAKDYARSIKERFNRMPMVTDFWEEFHLFVDKDNINLYPQIPIEQQLGGKNNYEHWLKNHKRKYNDFDDFVNASINQ